MNMRNKFYIIAFIIGLIFLLLNILTPETGDDWAYKYIFQQSPYASYTPIGNLADILESQYNHWYIQNGRFIPHFCLQTFSGVFGKGLFNIGNTIIFLAFLFLLLKLVSPIERKLTDTQKTHFFILSSSLIFLFFPDFKRCFLWMSGSFNYLWSGFFCLIFVSCMNSFTSKRKNSLDYVGLFILGLVCGWTHECIVLGLGVGYFVYYIFFLRHELTPNKLWLLIGFYLGVIFLVFAPGTINRGVSAIGTNVSVFSDYFTTLQSMVNLRLLPLLIIFLIILVCSKKLLLREFLYENIVWVVAILVSFVFIVLVKNTSARSRFGIELFSLILILKLTIRYPIKKYITWSFGCICFLLSALVIHICRNNYNNYQEELLQLQNPHTQYIITKKANFNRHLLRFVVSTPGGMSDVSYNSDFWANKAIAHAFKRKNAIFLPIEFVQDFVRNTNKYRQWHTLDELDFYAKRVDESVKFDELRMVIKRDKLKVEQYKKDQGCYPFSFVKIGNQDVMLVSKMIDLQK